MPLAGKYISPLCLKSGTRSGTGTGSWSEEKTLLLLVESANKSHSKDISGKKGKKVAYGDPLWNRETKTHFSLSLSLLISYI